MPADNQNAGEPPDPPDVEARNDRLSELCVRYFDKFVGYATRRLSRKTPDRREVAKDIVARTLERVVVHDPDGSVSALRAYWHRAVNNELQNEGRHAVVVHRSETALTYKLQGSDPSPESLYLAEETAEVLATTVEALPPRCRLAFKLARWDGCSTGEIAKRFAAEGVEVTPRQVLRYLTHAERVCREALAAYEQRKE